MTISMTDPKTRQREFEGLLEAMQAYGLKEGFIITMEEKEEAHFDEKAIHVLPAWEWMLQMD